MKTLLFFAAVLSIGLFSCKKKDPGPKRRATPKATIEQTDAIGTVKDTIVLRVN